MIKQREINTTNRIYIQDKELLNTNFKAGENYKYIIDKENKNILIVPDSEGNMKVSKRLRSHGINPVLDIKSKKDLSVFDGCDYMQLTIYEDRILVEGFTTDKESENISFSESEIENKSNITAIAQIIKVKKRESAYILKSQLKKVSGIDLSTQISFEDYFTETVSHSHSKAKSNILNFGEKLKNLPLALNIASLFSGCGVMDKGFTKEGFNISFAIDTDEGACETYKANIGNHIVNTDIRDYSEKDIPNCEVIIGGSPCQDFSNANRVSRFIDSPKNLLIREFIRVIKSKSKCKVFVLENVPQILTAGDGKFLKEIQEELSDFEITFGKLCAADYGSPQLRDRAFIIGSKIGKIQLPKPIAKAYATVRQAFKGLHDLISNQKDYSKPKDITLQRMSYVKQGENFSSIPEEIRPKGKHSNLYKRLEWDKPSITIANVRKSNILHPIYNRILSIRECARLFDLDDNFIFKGTLAQKQQMIANAVPVKLSQAIAKVVKDAIDKYNSKLKNNKLALV